MSRVIIKVKAKDLEEVISNLEKDQIFFEGAEYTLEVGIKDTKNNYQYLVNSPKIVQWDIINDEDNVENSYSSTSDKRKSKLNSELIEIFDFFSNDDNFKERYKSSRIDFLYSVIYELKKKTPVLRFTLGNIKTIIDNASMDHQALLVKESNFDNYLRNNNFEDYLEEVIQNIHDQWKYIDKIIDSANNYSELITALN